MPSSVRAPVIDVGVTLLKAPSMSRNAAREYSLLQNTREWRAVSVDLPLRYAYKAAVEEEMKKSSKRHYPLEVSTLHD